MNSLDFFIPEIYRGRRITLPPGIFERKHKDCVDLIIPENAHYVTLRSPMSEQGDQQLDIKSDEQHLHYFTAAGKHIDEGTQDFRNQAITHSLIARLGRIFERQA